MAHAPAAAAAPPLWRRRKGPPATTQTQTQTQTQTMPPTLARQTIDPNPRGNRRSSSTCLLAVVVVLVALAAYANSLGGEFVFDDFYAVVENADVSPRPLLKQQQQQQRPGPMPPLRALLSHDFWGQDMSSEQSHKSYRPVTVLAFRWTAQLWRWGWAGGWWGGVEAAADSGDGGAPSASLVPPWLSPLPFHVLAVLGHSAASAQVFEVALWLLGKRRQSQKRAGEKAADDPAAIPATAATPATAAALAAALLFALHPVHTEAVAGIVGSAEPLAAVLALAAFRVYGSAADGDAQPPQQHQKQKQQRRQPPPPPPPLHHWPRVALALALALLSALAKETGATVLGSMALYDALVALPPPPPHRAARDRRHRRRQLLRVLACAAALAVYVRLRAWVATGQAPSSRCSGDNNGGHLVRIYRRVENPIAFERDPWSRLFSTLHLHALYAGLLALPARLSADWSFECVPLTPPPWRRTEGSAAAAAAGEATPSLHLDHHARWLALYAALAWAITSARPLRLAADLLGSWWRAVVAGGGGGNGAAGPDPGDAGGGGGSGDGGGGDDPPAAAQRRRRARWRLFVVLGLIVAPFFPASNALFYVGTYIGERLLYLPSVGFCILLADALFPAAAATAADDDDDEPAPTTTTTTTAKPHRRRPPFAPPAKTTLLLLLLLLCAYAARTRARNRDWRDEPALFASALRVCPRSAKALLNSGVLARRRADAAGALRLFERAGKVDPTYCEVSYWVGLTLAERGLAQGAAAAAAAAAEEQQRQQQEQPRASAAVATATAAALARAGRELRRGMRELREGGVRCKYVAVQSVEALNRLYVQLQQRPPRAAAGGGAPLPPPPLLSELLLGPSAGAPAALLASWADVLADPAVSRPAEACAAYEDAALAVGTGAAAPFCGGGGGGGGAPDDDASPGAAVAALARRECVASLLGRCLGALRRAGLGQVAPDSLAEANLRRVAALAPPDDGDDDDEEGGGGEEAGGQAGSASAQRLSGRVARATGDTALLRDGAPRLAACVRLRRPVYLALAAGGGSPGAKRAAYAYLSGVSGGRSGGGGGEGAAPWCRGAGAGGGRGAVEEQEGGGGGGAAASSSALPPSPHQRLVHALQAADPADPWLQAEWSETLLALAARGAEGGVGGGRGAAAAAAAAAASKTAAKHFEVAALLLLRHADPKLKAGRALDPDPSAWPPPQQEVGVPPSAPLPVALRAAARFLRRRLELDLVPASDGGSRCALHQRLCHTLFHLASLAHHPPHTAADGDGDEDGGGGGDGAAAAAVGCARALDSTRRCQKEAEELRRALRF